MNESKKKWIAALAAEFWSHLLLAALFCSLFLFPGLDTEIGSALAANERSWRVTLFLFPTAGLLLLLVPVAVGRTILRQNNHLTPIARGFTLAALALIFSYVLADLSLHSRFGRHLTDLIAYLKLPHGSEAAGGIGRWLPSVAVILFWSTLSAVVLDLLSQWLRQKATQMSPFFQSVWLLVAGTFLVSIMASLWLLPPLMPSAFRTRLISSLAIQPTVELVVDEYQPQDPQLKRLQAALRRDYEMLFPFVFRRHELSQPKPVAAPLAPPRPKNIALVVAESLRWEQLTPSLMPRLWQWSERGLRAERHYSATNHSESGLFVALYGESALRYNSTLNQKAEPSLCRMLRTLQYRCGYFTGHPKIWMRREEFLNAQTMDIFAHDDRGDWNDWDARALKRATESINNGKNLFALTFLMSSHFEYRYPPQYEIHRPATLPRTSWLPGETKPDEYTSSRNRYLNVTAYLDDLIADHLDTLDPSETLILFTGDHGESTGEDGQFGHGYSFSDPLTRVPFFMVGPGIQPSHRTRLSSHHDILPTIFHALGQQTKSVALGKALQLPEEEEDRTLLSSYTKVGRPIITALLLHEGLRLRLVLDPVLPLVNVVGFQNALGKPIDVELSRAQVDGLSLAFRKQLELAGSIVQ